MCLRSDCGFPPKDGRARAGVSLDIGWSELLIIAIVMIGGWSRDLPKMLRAFGKATARMRSTANEFRQQFNEALKEAELEDVKNIVDEARKLRSALEAHSRSLTRSQRR